MKLCRVQVAAAAVVGAWVCLILVVGSGAVRVGPSRVEEEGEEYPYDPYPAEKISSTFKTVEFSFDASTLEATAAKDYRAKVIKVMRNQLKSSIEVLGIPSMPSNKVTGVNRFGLVTLNYNNSRSLVAVSLVIDVNNIYVAGFYSANPQKAYYYFTGDTAYQTDASKLFDNDTTVGSLGYGGDYVSLGGRSGVNLGRPALISAIEELYYRRNRAGWKSKLVVVIQMISEFVRSDFVMNRVLEKFDQSKPADADMQFVENNWSKNSKAVRSVTSASQHFGTPITLPSGTEIKNVDDANKVGLVSLLSSPSFTPKD